MMHPKRSNKSENKQRIVEVCSTQGLDLQRKLGGGSHGYVFEAKNLKTNELCVVKVIPNSKTTKANKAFQKEVLITQLLHENSRVVKLQKAFFTGDYGFLVIEKLQMDLMDYVISRKRLSEPEARLIFKEICLAVKYCHYNRIAHLDLKPENVLLNFDKRGYSGDVPSSVKLCDFGHSYNFNPFVRGDVVLRTVVPRNFKRVGTKQYRAPELCSSIPNRHIEIATADIWSLGVILFIMVTGSFPFSKATHSYHDGMSSNVREEEDYQQQILLNLPAVKKFASKSCFDLLSMMLEEDPQFRFDIDEVLCHHWFSDRVFSQNDHSFARNQFYSSGNYSNRSSTGKLSDQLGDDKNVKNSSSYFASYFNLFTGSFHQLLFSSALPSTIPAF